MIMKADHNRKHQQEVLYPLISSASQ